MHRLYKNGAEYLDNAEEYDEIIVDKINI